MGPGLHDPIFPRDRGASGRVVDDTGLVFQDDGSEQSDDSGLADILDS